MTERTNKTHTLNLAVVDDDPAFLKEMRTRLKRQFAGSPGALSLSTYADADSFWKGYQRKRHDVVMLDVMLPGESGIELARRIYRTDKKTVITFVTASPDYACHGYGVNAVGYMLKPVDDETVAGLLRECRKRLAPAPERFVMLKAEIGHVAVAVRSITHVESYYRKVRVHADDETLTCSGRLGEYLPQLGGRFLQVHKSFAVNLKRVHSVRYESLLMDNGAVVPVSRGRNQEVLEKYFACIAEDGGDE